MWAYRANQPDLVRVLECLFALANDLQDDGSVGPHPRAVFVLGGDVHSGSVHVISSRRSQPPFDHRRNAAVYQLIASPISNSPPTEKLYDYGARYVGSGGSGGIPLPIGSGGRPFDLEYRDQHYSAKLADLLIERNFGRIGIERLRNDHRVYRFYISVEGTRRALGHAIEIDLDAPRVQGKVLTPGLGIVALQPRFTCAQLHPEGTWFGGWRYANANRVAGLGDFDRDGITEVLITSDWGIGVLKRSGDGFDSAVAAPSGTWFGQWRYAGGDRIAGVGDFDGDGAVEVLVRSGWGMGILKLAGNALMSPVLHPEGTWFGDWHYAGGDRIVGVGDFDGDGAAEILVRSGWGMGILKLQGAAFRCFDLRRYSGTVGDWFLRRTDKVTGIGRLTGSPGCEVLLQSIGAWGVIEDALQLRFNNRNP